MKSATMKDTYEKENGKMQYKTKIQKNTKNSKNTKLKKTQNINTTATRIPLRGAERISSTNMIDRL